mgnify:CR=1 FL=1
MSIGKIKKIKIDISEQNDKIVCTVEIPLRGRHYMKKVLINTHGVIDYLNENGYNIPKASGVVKKIRNYKNGISNKGTWIFDLPKKNKETSKLPRKKRTYKKKQ